MYNINQYLAAAIRCGRIKHYEILDMEYDKHHAESLEIGINKEYLYNTAKKADWQMIFRSIILTILAFVGMDEISKFGYYSTEKAITDFLLYYVLPAVLVTFFFERSIIKAVKEISMENISPDDTTQHNLVTSGTNSPFSCYGTMIDSWNFALHTVSQDHGSFIQLPDNCHFELTDMLSAEISKVFSNPECSGKLFMQGVDAPRHREFFHNKKDFPLSHLGQHIVDNYASKSDNHLRYYYVISQSAWNSQTTVSALIKFRLEGEYIYGTIEYYFMPPLKKHLMILDSYVKINGLRGFLTTFSKSLYLFIPATLFSVIYISYILSAISKNFFAIFGIDAQAKQKATDPEYNYGHTPLRLMYSGDEYHRHYQKDDKERISKLMHTAISDTVIKYLQDKGIDVSDLKQNASIINSGILISGGNVTAGNIYTRVSEVVKRSLKKARK